MWAIIALLLLCATICSLTLRGPRAVTSGFLLLSIAFAFLHIFHG